MWGGDTEIEENKNKIGDINQQVIDLDNEIKENINKIGDFEKTIIGLDEEINNHKENMKGNLIWIIVCILLLIFVNIYITNKNVIITNKNIIISINVISIILLFGNLIMIVVNKYKRDTTAMKKSGKISRINLLQSQNDVLELSKIKITLTPRN